jgi:hypothetical protein
MEDIMVKYDGTVRNSLGDVIQFLYGVDGMDAVWIKSQKLDSLKVKKGKFDGIFKHDIDEENWTPSYISTEHVEDIKVLGKFVTFSMLKYNNSKMIESSLEPYTGYKRKFDVFYLYSIIMLSLSCKN